MVSSAEVVEFLPLSNRLSIGLHLPPCQTPNLLDTLASAGNSDSSIGPHNHFFSISSCVASCTAKSKSESPELLQDIKMPFLTVLGAPRRSSWVIEAEVRFFLNDAEGLMGPVNLNPVDISSTIAKSSKSTLSNISRNRHNRLPCKMSAQWSGRDCLRACSASTVSIALATHLLIAAVLFAPAS